MQISTDRCDLQIRSKSRISVIIPTLNAAATLPATLASLAPGRHLITEIIVVDGGSTDGTQALAPRLITTQPSRGAQLAAGAAAATAEFLLLIHADTTLSPSWPQAAAAAMAQPQTAHYFRFRLNSPARAARIIETLVALRCRAAKLPYGDQALLISQTLLAQAGGIPNIPIMEDVALARRLRHHLQPLSATAITAATRYQGAWARRPLRNLICLTLYFAGISPHRIKRLYD